MGDVNLISANEVLKLTGYKSRTTLWRRVRAGEFPKPLALSPSTTRWRKSDIEEWIEALPEMNYSPSEFAG